MVGPEGGFAQEGVSRSSGNYDAAIKHDHLVGCCKAAESNVDTCDYAWNGHTLIAESLITTASTSRSLDNNKGTLHQAC